MAKTAIFLAEGYEEIEALAVVDVFRRAGIVMDMVSISDELLTKGSHKIQVIADKLIEDICFDEYDMLVLPGGLLGMQNLEACVPLMQQVDKFFENDKYVAAICASPSILGRRGILEGRQATAYPGFEAELKGATVVDAGAVRCGHVITGRSMGSAIEFALLLVETLLGKEKAEEIAAQIVYK